MLKSISFVFLLVLAGCSSSTIFDREEGLDFTKIHRASLKEVVRYFGMPTDKYTIKKGKKGTTILKYVHDEYKTRSRGRRGRTFGFGSEFYMIDFSFSFNSSDQLAFAKFNHSYTGSSSGRFSKMENEVEGMNRALTAQAGKPETVRFGRRGIQHTWSFNGAKKIKVKSSPSLMKSKSKPKYNYMVQTKFWFKI